MFKAGLASYILFFAVVCKALPQKTPMFKEWLMGFNINWVSLKWGLNPI